MLRIKEILKQKGILGKNLAEQLGMTENAMSLIVNGKRQPRYEDLGRIAEALDVDIRDLFESTKTDKDKETIYVLRDGEYVPIGEILKRSDD